MHVISYWILKNVHSMQNIDKMLYSPVTDDSSESVDQLFNEESAELPTILDGLFHKVIIYHRHFYRGASHEAVWLKILKFMGLNGIN